MERRANSTGIPAGQLEWPPPLKLPYITSDFSSADMLHSISYFDTCTPSHCWYCSVGVSEHDAVLLPVCRHHADQLSHGGGVGETVARRKEPGWWGAIDEMASTLLLTTYILYTRSTHATASFCPFLSSSSAMFALAEKKSLPRHDVPECFGKWDSDPAKNGTCRQCV